MDTKTCPNCGAPISSFECKYCGATFYDFVNLSFDKPIYIRFKHQDGNVWLMNGFLNKMNVEMSTNEVTSIGLDFGIKKIQQQPEMYLSAQFVGRTK